MLARREEAGSLRALRLETTLETARAGPRKTKGSDHNSEARRLDANAWADAALTELAEHGIDGVRVEVLAKLLRVTKGSFYWHFKDRDALLAAMLERWRRRATLLLIERLDRAGSSPADRLSELLRLPMRGQRSVLAAEIELAIRLWGRTDPRARSALEEVDDLRLEYLTRLFVEVGCSKELARARAILAYSYLRVGASLINPDATELMQQCEALLMGRDPGQA